MNLQKLNEGWRSILRQTRGTELHEEIVELSQKFETDLEGLDSIVKVIRRRTARFKPLLILYINMPDSQRVTVCWRRRAWNVTCRGRSASWLRCGAFTCSVWSVCGPCRTNG